MYDGADPIAECAPYLSQLNALYDGTDTVAECAPCLSHLNALNDGADTVAECAPYLSYLNALYDGADTVAECAPGAGSLVHSTTISIIQKSKVRRIKMVKTQLQTTLQNLT